MEYLDIRTIDGKLTGEVKPRTQVHADGDIHGTSHVWIIRQNEVGEVELLLQKRSMNKDAYPGYYDISSAGHLPSGQDYLSSALRELEEELGIKAEEEDLHFLGIHEGYFEEVFHGSLFKNHEVSFVYLYEKPVSEKEIQFQDGEVDSVIWMSLRKCREKMKEKEELYRCLIPHEIDMIEAYMRQK